MIVVGVREDRGVDPASRGEMPSGSAATLAAAFCGGIAPKRRMGTAGRAVLVDAALDGGDDVVVGGGNAI